MKPQEILHLAIATMPLVVAIWRIAKIINGLEKDLAIHKDFYEERKEFVDYRLNALHEAIKHKFQRCMDEINELKQ